MQKEFQFKTIEDQRAVFGTQDIWARKLESDLNVSLTLRGDSVEIGGDESSKAMALQVLKAMVQLTRQGEELREDTVERLIEESREGSLDSLFKAMENAVTMNYKGLPIKCKTFGQQNYVEMLREKAVTICIGPAGTGKTYLAVAQAAQELKEGLIERIIMSRPAIEAGEERLGFLPGDLAQKVDPYLRPLYDALRDVFGQERADKLRENGVVEVAPLAYMRGRTLNHARIIIDEGQNASLSTLKMALTRLGEDSRMVLTGDVTQIDLPKVSDSGLTRCAEILRGVEGIGVIHLTNRDVVRNKIVKDIVKAFEKEEARQAERREAPHTPDPNKRKGGPMYV
nr:PhoH family protein [Lachnospiraceae bacterium]